ncbi:SDR family oxidoreductase [Rhodococcus sp. NPDC127593]|uniref:SDR family oxidoreductase n=1 Tax=Rhodococcus sp. NPDC127593 TaxID=3345404 RepID=UPI003639B002
MNARFTTLPAITQTLATPSDKPRSAIPDPEFDAWLRGRAPAGRWGTPDDLVGPAVWLASDGSRYVNGQVIFIDGGMTSVV